ncbi:MAG: hypothetical protein ACOC1K_01810 [Nanoarchaeota archaeon]
MECDCGKKVCDLCLCQNGDKLECPSCNTTLATIGHKRKDLLHVEYQEEE